MGRGSDDFRRLVRRQAGVVARWQAARCGFSAGRIDRLQANGEWRRTLPGVYIVGDYPTTFETQVWAAWLWAGSAAAVTGAAAARWWRLTELVPSRVELTVPPRCNPRDQDAVAVRRRLLSTSDVISHNGVRVASRAYAATLGAAAFGAPGQPILDRALLRDVRLADARAVVDRNPRAPAAALARRWLAAAADGSASGLERSFLALMRRAGIGGWRINLRLESGQRYQPDCAIEEFQLLVELDGWAFHSGPEQFVSDRRRQNSLVLAGWTVLRFTWWQVTNTPDQVVADVRAAIASRSRRRGA